MGTGGGWFDRNTHHWREWSVEDLVAVKADTRVSLVVPARNEAATVGDIVTRVRETLVGTARLLDEIVVIDSDSTDATYAVATDAGAVVHRSAEIRPDLGSLPGKGEAMWKSLFVTTGDVLVFMDADLIDWDTHFVPGLLGPILTRPEIALVKGYYERPGEQGTLDGGRVTELVARPLIALEHPELTGLVQPLAGEWAIRRSLFEALSVPTGYAVELAALVDTVAALGVDAIAQVDLGRRAHRHQPLLDLGAMAVQILAAMSARRVPVPPPVEERANAAPLVEERAQRASRNQVTRGDSQPMSPGFEAQAPSGPSRLNQGGSPGFEAQAPSGPSRLNQRESPGFEAQAPSGPSDLNQRESPGFEAQAPSGPSRLNQRESPGFEAQAPSGPSDLNQRESPGFEAQAPSGPSDLNQRESPMVEERAQRASRNQVIDEVTLVQYAPGVDGVRSVERMIGVAERPPASSVAELTPGMMSS